MSQTKQLGVRIPAELLASVKQQSGGLKLYAIVEQALELWLRERGSINIGMPQSQNPELDKPE